MPDYDYIIYIPVILIKLTIKNYRQIMYYQSPDIRASTIITSQQLRQRKSSTVSINASRQLQERLRVDYQQNITPLFYNENKTQCNSVELKRQVRRKTGSIGKIIRNTPSQQKLSNQKERRPLMDGNNYLNSKLQFDKENNEHVGAYKQLYEKNKVLNQALKSKIYQGTERTYNTGSIIGLSDFGMASKTAIKSSKIHQNIDKNVDFRQRSQKSQVINTQYQAKLDQYDSMKRSFVKDQMQALKQKTALQNFTRFDPYQLPRNQFDSVIENYDEPSRYRTEKKQKLTYQDRSSGVETAVKPHIRNFQVLHQNSHIQKEDEIDQKFKAYQQKIQKHKNFEKRTASVNKKTDLSNHKDKFQAVNETFKKQSVSKSIKNTNTSSKTAGSESVKIFIDLLWKQIEKDEQLRVIKNNLKNIPTQDLQKIFKQKYSFDLDPERLKLSTEEYDPFFEPTSNQTTVDQWAWKFFNAFEIAENFWKNLVVGRFSKQELINIYEILNYGKKNQIEINELARQLSYHLKRTVISREIYSLYKRLCPLTKDNFVTKLSAKSSKI